MFWSLNRSYWKSGKGSSQIVPRHFLSSQDIEGKPLSASMPCVLDWGFCCWISLPPLRPLVPWESTWPPAVPHFILTEHRPSPRGADTVSITRIPTLAHFSASPLVCDAVRVTVNRKCLQDVRYSVSISTHMIYSPPIPCKLAILLCPFIHSTN